MKNLITLLCLITLTACALPQKEEKFVNPIFYKPMEGLKYYPDLYKILPNKLFTQNYYGYNTTVDCELLENTMNTVVLKCLHTPEPKGKLQVVGTDGEPTIWTYKFYIWPPEEQDDDGTYVRVYHYPRNEKDWSSYSNLFIYNDENSYMDVWKNAINTFTFFKSVDSTNTD